MFIPITLGGFGLLCIVLLMVSWAMKPNKSPTCSADDERGDTVALSFEDSAEDADVEFVPGCHAVGDLQDSDLIYIDPLDSEFDDTPCIVSDLDKWGDLDLSGGDTYIGSDVDDLDLYGEVADVPMEHSFEQIR